MNYIHQVMWNAVQEVNITHIMKPAFHLFSVVDNTINIDVIKSKNVPKEFNSDEYVKTITDFKMQAASSIANNIHSFLFVEFARIAFSDDEIDDAIIGQVVDRFGSKVSLCIPMANGLPIDDVNIIHLHDAILDNAFNSIANA
jgi:hypothetical protein